jgi:acyl-CoA synthetase (AMP-forming)/AMP-acid ligase II
MHGLMMDTPLMISSIAEHAVKFHGDREIVSVTAEDPRHRYTFRDAIVRSKRLANALAKFGFEQGTRLATMAWTDYRHLEIYYATSGSGFVCHTINPRLFAEQLEFIINHAEDRIIFVDPMFVPLLEGLQDQITGVEYYIVLTDEAHMPATSLKNALCYEVLIAGEPDEFDWPQLDERTAAALCYTSGTTGNPKGVLYSHRSTILHSLSAIAPDHQGLSARDCVLPVVPLFHVNAWGLPYSALMTGSKLVLPGPQMGNGEVLYELMESEKVTIAFGVPTVWLSLLAYTDKDKKTLHSLERAAVGGSAVPRSMFEAFRDKHQVALIQGWGMTETSPFGVMSTPKGGMETQSYDEWLDYAIKAGRGIYGLDMRIVDDNGAELPWDGVTYGALQVRGPWVCSDYFKLDGSAGTHTSDGWFDTGDVATIDPEGYMAITDRTKDVIKSGGEWISSIELENHAIGHPAVAEAAVIGVPHAKWGERPLLVVALAENASATTGELLGWFDGKVASWWIPNDAVIVDELPHTATGKIRKIELREKFADYKLSE